MCGHIFHWFCNDSGILAHRCILFIVILASLHADSVISIINVASIVADALLR